MRLSIICVLAAAGLVSGAAIPVRNGVVVERNFMQRASLNRETRVEARASQQSSRAVAEQDTPANSERSVAEAEHDSTMNPRSHGWDAVERNAVDIWVE